MRCSPAERLHDGAVASGTGDCGFEPPCSGQWRRAGRHPALSGVVVSFCALQQREEGKLFQQPGRLICKQALRIPERLIENCGRRMSFVDFGYKSSVIKLNPFRAEVRLPIRGNSDFMAGAGKVKERIVCHRYIDAFQLRIGRGWL